MLIVEKSTQPNGAHRNQSGDFHAVPEGWVAVPLELEAKALEYLPFIVLTIEDGVLVDVAQGEIPEPMPEPEPTIDEITALQLAVAELAEAQSADQTANELALAELAEIVLGG